MHGEDVLLFSFLAFLAEVAGTISGFGSSVFFVPIAGIFFDFYSVLGITALFHLFSNVSKIILFKKGVDWSIIAYLGIPAIVFVGVGAWMSKWVKLDILELVLSVFLITFSLIFLLARNLKIRPTKLNSAVGGTLSGFVAGLVGTGGAIRGMTLAAFNLNKEVFIATSALIDFGVDLSRGVVYYSNGFMHLHDMYYVGILFVISIVGTLAGKKILGYFSEEQFKHTVLIVIIGIGIVTLVKSTFF